MSRSRQDDIILNGGDAMRAALYARVSTADKDQDPETQLVALRDFCQAQGWEVYREYVDRAAANDFRGRTAWRDMMDDMARRRFSIVLVFKLDRAFRSVKHMHDTLAAWEVAGAGFQSVREGFDTRTALGRLLLNLLASLAEFELEVLGERVRAGMERAKRQGKRVGRPRAMDKPEVAKRADDVLGRVERGEISLRKAAKELGVGVATVARMRCSKNEVQSMD